MSLTLDRLKHRPCFVQMTRVGSRWVTPYFVLQMAPSSRISPHRPMESAADIRLGLTVTKKQGNAVIRNRIKRRLKEAARQVMPVHALAGYDYVLIGRASAVEAPFDEIVKNLRWALKRIHGADTQRDA